ncbi:hypothetical protein [Mesorhizobium sp. M0909]|uniref:hypothetical protein n=1 Tax=Mesorhizobium sp. M0909 TaxID=2957024 RepID=UPI003336A708
MRQSRAHSLLATMVSDPGFFAKQSPSAQSKIADLCCGGIRGKENIRAIIQFAGLITKVRHNQLHEVIPLTMRAIYVARIEIEFFTWYASEFSSLRAQRPFELESRLQHFLSRLNTFLRVEQPGHAFVREVMDHEARLRSLTSLVAAPGLAPQKARYLGQRAPKFDGTLLIAPMKWSPSCLEAALASEELSGDAWRPLEERTYLYALQRAGETVSYFEVDLLAATFIRFVNSGFSLRQVAEIIECEMGIVLSVEAISNIYENLAAVIPISLGARYHNAHRVY